MNYYLTTETLRSQRNDLLFCFSLRRRKAKSIHLRWVGFLKAMSCSIIVYCGLLQLQFQLPSGFPSPPSQRRWKKISSSAFSAPRAKRAVMSYSRTYPHSKAGTISIAEGLRVLFHNQPVLQRCNHSYNRRTNRTALRQSVPLLQLY